MDYRHGELLEALDNMIAIVDDKVTWRDYANPDFRGDRIYSARILAEVVRGKIRRELESAD